MRYFLDTEFIDNGTYCLDLLSIGVVSEDGFLEYYAINRGARLVNANDFVRRHVLPCLVPDTDAAWKDPEQLRQELGSLFDAGDPTEIWTYYGAYDRVVLGRFFGPGQWPATWPDYFLDIKQWAVQLGRYTLPDKPRRHHALDDAYWTWKAWLYLAYHEVPEKADYSSER